MASASKLAAISNLRKIDASAAVPVCLWAFVVECLTMVSDSNRWRVGASSAGSESCLVICLNSGAPLGRIPLTACRQPRRTPTQAHGWCPTSLSWRTGCSGRSGRSERGRGAGAGLQRAQCHGRAPGRGPAAPGVRDRSRAPDAADSNALSGGSGRGWPPRVRL